MKGDVPSKALIRSRLEMKAKVLQGEKANSYFGSALFIAHNTRVSDRLFDMSGPLIKRIMIYSSAT